MRVGREPPERHLHPCQTEMACWLHGPDSCSSAWGGLRLPGWKCWGSSLSPSSSWGLLASLVIQARDGKRAQRRTDIAQSGFKTTSAYTDLPLRPTKLLGQPMPLWRRERNEPNASEHFLTTPHGVLLTCPLVLLHLGAAAFLLCLVIAAVMPVAAPGRE